MSLAHYQARLGLLVLDVIEDDALTIEDVITFLASYDDKRKILDRVQANNMKGRNVGDTMKHFSTMDDHEPPRPRVATMAGDAPELMAELARPEREGREGDTQPMPKGNDLPVMHHLVQRDLEDRLQVGIKRYGQPLQPHNGRNALRDAYEEALDLAVYLRQAIYESEHPSDPL